ncbi:hypothetical protein ACFL0M_12240 [Thermodesulfobacteriota bacterium]
MVELGTRRTTERVRAGNSPPKAARAVFLSQAGNQAANRENKLQPTATEGPDLLDLSVTSVDPEKLNITI